jgi:type 1 glutamine amidotransferase
MGARGSEYPSPHPISATHAVANHTWKGGQSSQGIFQEFSYVMPNTWLRRFGQGRVAQTMVSAIWLVD